MTRARRVALFVVAGLALVALLVGVREGGCDRAPPDDDEPVPACKPGDTKCEVDIDPAQKPLAGVTG